ncbi:MAG: FG-GAP repeat protein [Planctomycetota bacterium]
MTFPTRRHTLPLTAVLLGAFGFSASSQAQVPADVVLFAQPDILGDQFAFALEGDGGAAIAYSNTALPVSQGVSSGSVHIIDLKNGRWDISAAFGPTRPFPAPPSINLYGRRLAISGEWAATLATTNVPEGGLIYIYRRTDGIWSEFQVIEPGPVTQERFYFEIAMSDNRMVLSGVNTPLDIYEFDGSTWTHTAQIATPFGTVSEEQRYEPRLISFSGDRILEVRSFNLSAGIGPAVYVYEDTGTTWEHIDTVLAPTQALNAGFANRGAFGDGQWLGVTDTGADLSRPGRLQLFRWDDSLGRYRFHSILEAPDPISIGSPISSNYFSFDVDIDGDRLIVGAPYQGSPNEFLFGAAYLFEYDAVADEWRLEQEYRPPLVSGPFFGITNFGATVALLEGAVLVGDPIAPINGIRCGAVYLYEQESGEPYCPGTPGLFGLPGQLRANGAPVAQTGEIRLEADFVPFGAPYIVLASTSAAQVPLPGGGAEFLCVGAPRLATGGVRTTGNGLATIAFPAYEPPLDGVVPGDTVRFQLWFRGSGGGQPTGVTNALAVVFK